MPTFLERIVGSLGGGLDDKARTALLQLDGVNAVSILKKLESRGEEVRNPSAFVAKAVAKGSSKGAGQDELRCALEQIKKDGLIDEKAVDMITKGKAGFTDICTAVSVFLSQEESSVHNPSAYITRSITNAAKHVQPGAVMMHAGHPGGYGGASMHPGGYGYPASRLAHGAVQRPSLASHPMMHTLDDAARQALEAAGFETASAILAELQSKGPEIRNPSAYVLRSATNARKGIGAAAGAATAGHSFGPPPYSYAPPAQFRYLPPPPLPPRNGAGQHWPTETLLDERANAVLAELPPHAAAEVWGQFESVKSTVRNPSAYISRAVENYWKGGSQGKGAAVALEPHGALEAPTDYLGGVALDHVAANRELIAPWLGSLDENAVSALEGADAQVVASCLAELEAKLESVRNPSAYVVRAISNAKRGRPAGPQAGDASFGGLDSGAEATDEYQQASSDLGEELSMLPSPLDLKATAALEEVGPAAALTIVQNLKQKSGTIGNPSAYVMKAVQNHKQGDRNVRQRVG